MPIKKDVYILGCIDDTARIICQLHRNTVSDMIYVYVNMICVFGFVWWQKE